MNTLRPSESWSNSPQVPINRVGSVSKPCSLVVEYYSRKQHVVGICEGPIFCSLYFLINFRMCVYIYIFILWQPVPKVYVFSSEIDKRRAFTREKRDFVRIIINRRTSGPDNAKNAPFIFFMTPFLDFLLAHSVFFLCCRPGFFSPLPWNDDVSQSNFQQRRPIYYSERGAPVFQSEGTWKLLARVKRKIASPPKLPSSLAPSLIPRY